MELKHAFASLERAITQLLIVPYGIETNLGLIELMLSLALNCTLWN